MANTLLYGLPYGPIALPCSGPVMVGIFDCSLTAQKIFGKLPVFIGSGWDSEFPWLCCRCYPADYTHN